MTLVPLLLALVLVAMCGFFVAAEFALVTVDQVARQQDGELSARGTGLIRLPGARS